MRIVSATDADVNGKLFLSPEGRMYRGIRGQSAPLFRGLLDSGLLQSLAQDGLLVETSLSDRPIAGYPLVLEHHRIPYVTYASEWPPEMLREATLQILALQHKLITAGIQLHDAHCNNVLFDGTRPVFVDVGSLEVLSERELWPALDEFCRWSLYPLTMSAGGYSSEARTLLRDYMHAVPGTLVEKLCPDLTANWSHASYAGADVTESNRLRLIDTLKREISDVPLSRHKTEWSEYHLDTPAGIEPCDGWRPKQQVFYKILQKVRPKTLVDIGSNRGAYGQIAARLGITVAAFDRDETTIADLYKDAVDRSLPMTSLVCDLMDPAPARGINCRWMPSVHERLRSDMAVALALIHHLVFKLHLDFEQIATCFASFAREWLLVEFIPRGDKWVSQWLRPEHDWYDLPGFLDALRKHFRHIEILPSDPDPRIFILCKR